MTDISVIQNTPRKIKITAFSGLNGVIGTLIATLSPLNAVIKPE